MAPVKRRSARSRRKPPEAAQQRRVVGPGRVERPTSRLSGVRSNHLSYEPERGVGETGTRRVPWIRANSSRAGCFDRRKGNEGGGKSPICLSTEVWNSS